MCQLPKEQADKQSFYIWNQVFCRLMLISFDFHSICIGSQAETIHKSLCSEFTMASKNNSVW